MGIINKIIINRKLKSELKATLAKAEKCLKITCAEMANLLKVIHSSKNMPVPELVETFKTSRTEQITEQLYEVEYYFLRYQEEIENLKRFNEIFNSKHTNSKLNKAISIETQLKNSFIEIYSKFLVQVQFGEELKENLKTKFIQVIHNLQIPLHTNEQKTTKHSIWTII